MSDLLNKHMQAKKEKTPRIEGRTLAETVKLIHKKFGEESFMKLDQKPNTDVDVISTGSFGLDIALGIGGLPRGRIVEIFGPEASGKTTLALHVIAEAQKTGGICAFIDAEHAMDPQYAKRLGVDTKALFISQPQSGEEGLQIVEDIVSSGKFDVVVVDSVALLTPKDEIDGVMGQQHVGRQARLMSHALRKLTGIIALTKTIVIFVNQIRTQIGMAYGNPEFTPGGKALKFGTSVRLEIRRIAHIKKGEETIGGRVRVKVAKNKVAPPFRQTEFDLMYGEGISQEGELLALGELHNIIQKSGSSYSYGDLKLGRGYESSRQFLKTNKDVAEDIKTNIRAELGVARTEDGESETSTDES